MNDLDFEIRFIRTGSYSVDVNDRSIGMVVLEEDGRWGAWQRVGGLTHIGTFATLREAATAVATN